MSFLGLKSYWLGARTRRSAGSSIYMTRRVPRHGNKVEGRTNLLLFLRSVNFPDLVFFQYRREHGGDQETRDFGRSRRCVVLAQDICSRTAATRIHLANNSSDSLRCTFRSIHLVLSHLSILLQSSASPSASQTDIASVWTVLENHQGAHWLASTRMDGRD